MKLYNTLTRTVEDIKPITDTEVSIYTCGPTVYDYPHVGNWYTFIRYDLLVRVLKSSGLNPKWVMNITDVGHLVSDADDGEDKLEKGAQREGKSAWKIAEFYSEYFVNALQRLSISQPDELPKATDHIPEQIELIKTLQEKGFVYQISDGVYFDTSKFEQYAIFAKLNLEELQEGARVTPNPEKKNTTDFALWKFSPKDAKRDMEWESPWGTGFPGWHLECSAMAMKYLGKTVDIHSGGIDHVPVHHSNEIAQSEAATGVRYANHWMHTNHISVDGQKISKSLGNSITLEDIENEGYSLEVFKLLVLESHYRTQGTFNFDVLEAAQNRLSSYQAMADHMWQPHHEGKLKPELISSAKADIKLVLEDDLNTPQALAILSGLESAIDSGGINVECQEAFKNLLKWLDDTLGLNLSKRADIEQVYKDLLTARQQARDKQDWAKSDEIRDQLLGEGISIKDTALGQVWHRTNLFKK